MLAKVSLTAWELSDGPVPGGIITRFTSRAEAVFPAVAAVAAKLTRNGLDAVIKGCCSFMSTSPRRSDSAPPGPETRGWRTNAGVPDDDPGLPGQQRSSPRYPQIPTAQPILNAGPYENARNPVRDLDHVVMPDGRIYRVVG